MPLLGNLIKKSLSVGNILDQRPVAPGQSQHRTLRRLIRKASHTAFGQYYNFKDLLKSPRLISDFKQTVPIHDYDLIHDRWWHMSLNHVENVTWKGYVRHFALSSGTSGAPSKHIPVTDDMLRSMRRAGLKMFIALNNFDIDPELYTKPMLMLGGSSDLQHQKGYFMGDLSGINASKPPFWLRPYYKPGTKIARINDWDSKISEIAKKAPEWDIGFLVGIPSWLQLMMERVIEYHQVDTIHDIWPNLSVCVHGGIAFEPYKKGFEKLLARPIIYMDSYLASEGFIAYQARPETRAMRVVLNVGIFYEFIPFTEENFDDDGHIIGTPKSFTIDQVEENRDYALLITTCAGAWRYLIGDTVRFLDKERNEIIITGRTKHFLSICGEHLSIDNMNHGIQALEEELGLSIREFTVIPVHEGNFFAHKWYIGVEEPADADRVKTVLDERLKQINDDYRIERKAVLGIQVQLLPIATFYNWQAHKGKLGGQNKFPRVMKGELAKEWEAFVVSGA
ncbi:MAG TPA: GH3 auxin-responsive promoter family protein [Saprospiraceae bacterium]|nr:GH3 auxin-responsive promoter family protein [Saprospiraceae bacterium]HMQ82178.1 GH3 auxin-responsive promoter family protein [Saprospiraceae bacterium]